MAANPKFKTLAVFLAGLLLFGLAVRWYWNKRRPPSSQTQGNGSPEEPNPNSPLEKPSVPVAPAPVSEARVGVLGVLRVSDDAASKNGDFWIEEFLEWDRPLPTGNLTDLYLIIDPKRASGIRLRLKSDELLLERVLENPSSADPQAKAPAPELLARAEIPNSLPPLSSSLGEGHRGILGALWRGGELSVWWNEALLLTWKGALDLKGPSATAVATQGLHQRAPRVLPLGTISFRDTFMRESAGYAWRPVRGKWELTALAFPERSANPFSLRASFGNEAPVSDRLYKGRFRGEHYGLGIQLSSQEGTLKVIRITGGSPAARAGLQEDDTLVEMDGTPIDQIQEWRVQQLLYGRAWHGNDSVTLKVLRPGAKKLIEIPITPDRFVWGTPMEGQLLRPVSDDKEALVLGGEAGWSDYAAEVALKPLGAGACGLAIAATSPEDYLLFRWLGPPARAAGQLPAPMAESLSHQKLQLLRVQRGQERVLAEKPVRYRPYEFYRMALDWKGEEIIARVDDVEVFRQQVPGLRRGQIGLYALRGQPVFFDDVVVMANREEFSSAHRTERKFNAVFSGEQDMESWANPALEWNRDIKTGWALHTARFPGEQAVVLNKPAFEDLEVALACGPAMDGAYPALTVRNGQATLGLKKSSGTMEGAVRSTAIGPGPYLRIVIRAGKAGISGEIDGVALEGPVLNEEACLQFGRMDRDTDRIAIRGLKNLGDPATVRASSTGILEYTFNAAPVDWKVESGRWGLLNKWICDPRWSWFGGRSETLAAIWNKQVFSGDICMDAYVALMMEQDDPPYERAGDYNLIVCGDGAHLDSGYSLVFGGGSNYWTRLYRNGVQVAESREEKFRLPSDRVRQLDKPELHQRWFHLRLEKSGRQVSFYRDGEKAFTFTDPEPLTAGRVGFWTMDNGVLLARCRIACSAVQPGPLETRESALYDDGVVLNMLDGEVRTYNGEVHTRVEREALPREIREALGQQGGAFRQAEADAQPEAPASDAPGSSGWRVTNGTGGGPMVLQWKTLQVDPAAMGVVRFAIRMEPGAAVDLLLRDTDSTDLFRWRLSGPEASDERMPLVGRIPGIPADGRWHTVQFDLTPSWNAFWKQRNNARSPRRILRPLFGCFEQSSYALAGFGVNRKGTAYAVSELAFLKPEDVDTTPPRLAKVIWPYDPDGDGVTLKLQFDDAGGSGIDPETLQLTLAGQAIAQNALQFNEVTQTATLDLRTLRQGKLLAEGESLDLTLARFTDRAGHSAAGGLTSSWTFHAAQASDAKKPVDPPEIQVLMDADDGAFGTKRGNPPGSIALGPADLFPREGFQDASIQFTADAPPGATIRRSVKAVALNDGSNFGFRLRDYSYNLAAWPYLQLEYKIPSEVPVNLYFQDSNGQRLTLLLTDIGVLEDVASGRRRGRWRAAPGGFLGPPEDFVDDGTWRKVEVPLQKWISQSAAANLGQPPWNVGSFDFREGGWRGNRRGMEYAIHALRALPAARSKGIAFQWPNQGTDLTGIQEYASAVDERSDTDPVGKGIRPYEVVEGAARRALAEAGKTPAAAEPLAADGWKYLHVKVKNGAGLWSPVTHYKFRVDNTPPRVVETQPEAGGRIAGKTFRIRLKDDHAVVPGSIRLSVNGDLFADGQPGVSYNVETGVLTFDGTRVGQALGWENGTSVEVELQSVTDCLGNRLQEPFRFTFKIDRSLDQKGPAIAQVRIAAPGGAEGQAPPRPALLEWSMALDFEETLGHVRALQDCRLDWTDDPATAAFGRRALRFTAFDDDADIQILLHKNAWHLDQYPLLQFDYKAEEAFKVDVQVQVMGEWYTLKFLGDGNEPKNYGTVQGVRADGQWRHAGMDLRAAVERAVPRLPVRIISALRLASHGIPGTKRGATFWLDNLHLCPDAGAGAQLEWAAEADESGIEGYSVIVDQNPTTIAPTTVGEYEPRRAEGGREGTWYAHIRAKDQAGNWGPTRHFRMDF